MEIYNPPRKVILRDDQPDKEKWAAYFAAQYQALVDNPVA
jgi:hypothetical protein